MKHYVYILECRDENRKITLYVGYTSRTPSIRLRDHINNVRSNNKKHYTSRQKFVRLVYYETYGDRKTALAREKEIKKLGSRYKQGLIDGMRNLSKGIKKKT